MIVGSVFDVQGEGDTPGCRLVLLARNRNGYGDLGELIRRITEWKPELVFNCCEGFGGDDIILGQAGLDTLNGDAGNDNINGGDGADSLIGNSGNNAIDGGTGADTMVGGLGSDAY